MKADKLPKYDTNEKSRKNEKSYLYNENQVSVLVAGFPKESLLSEIRDFISEVSKRKKFTVLKGKKNKFRGLVFVHFTDIEEANEFVKKSLFYGDTLQDIKVALDHDDYIEQSLESIRNPKKVFIEDLPKCFEKNNVESIFEKYGEIEELVLIEKCKKGNQMAFITYKDSSSAKTLCDLKQISTGNNILLDVNYARPQFSPYMMQKIDPIFKEYLKSVKKEIIPYDPQDFIHIEDKLSHINNHSIQSSKEFMKNYCFQKNHDNLIELRSKKMTNVEAKKHIFSTSEDSDREIHPIKKQARQHEPKNKRKLCSINKNNQQPNSELVQPNVDQPSHQNQIHMDAYYNNYSRQIRNNEFPNSTNYNNQNMQRSNFVVGSNESYIKNQINEYQTNYDNFYQNSNNQENQAYSNQQNFVNGGTQYAQNYHGYSPYQQNYFDQNCNYPHYSNPNNSLVNNSYPTNNYTYNMSMVSYHAPYQYQNQNNAIYPDQSYNRNVNTNSNATDYTYTTPEYLEYYGDSPNVNENRQLAHNSGINPNIHEILESKGNRKNGD